MKYTDVQTVVYHWSTTGHGRLIFTCDGNLRVMHTGWMEKVLKELFRLYFYRLVD